MLQNFCFRFRLIENWDFFVDDCTEFDVAFVVRPSLFSLAILGDEEIFLMLHAFFEVVFEFGNFELAVVTEL